MTNNLTIILVHGAWADGSQWRKIIPALQKTDYKVFAVQLSLNSLENDVFKTVDLIDAQEGQVLLVGHSYGGAVITVAGNHNKVIGMVFIAAFAPDRGENVGTLLAKRESYATEYIVPDKSGYLWLQNHKFHNTLCQDLGIDEAMVLAACQRPIMETCIGMEITDPAWKNKKCWYQISLDDRILPAATQEEMANRMQLMKVIKLDSGHLSMLSNPDKISSFILEAALNSNSLLEK